MRGRIQKGDHPPVNRIPRRRLAAIQRAAGVGFTVTDRRAIALVEARGGLGRRPASGNNEPCTDEEDEDDELAHRYNLF